MFLLHFDVLCNPLLNRRTATWNLFVLYNDDVIYTSVKIVWLRELRIYWLKVNRYKLEELLIY